MTFLPNEEGCFILLSLARGLAMLGTDFGNFDVELKKD